jgi:hypothetical protein
VWRASCEAWIANWLGLMWLRWVWKCFEGSEGRSIGFELGWGYWYLWIYCETKQKVCERCWFVKTHVKPTVMLNFS